MTDPRPALAPVSVELLRALRVELAGVPLPATATPRPKRPQRRDAPAPFHLAPVPRTPRRIKRPRPPRRSVRRAGVSEYRGPAILPAPVHTPQQGR